jgi:hypothetical protein
MRRGFIIAICVMCLFNGCVCNCGPSSAGSCEPTDAGNAGCNFDAGLTPIDSGTPDSTLPGEDGGPDATDEAEAGEFGTCNGMLCPAGCSCDIVDEDAGGGVACECPGAGDGGDAGDGGQADASLDAAAPDATAALDASDGATSADGSASVGDAGGHGDASPDATTDASEPSACGVITCGAGCACASPAASQCVCP